MARIKPAFRELTFFGGDGACRLAAVLVVAAGCAIIVAAVRLSPPLVLAAIAAGSAAFLDLLLARARWLTLERHPTARRSLLVLPIVVLTVTSIVCLLLSFVA